MKPAASLVINWLLNILVIHVRCFCWRGPFLGLFGDKTYNWLNCYWLHMKWFLILLRSIIIEFIYFTLRRSSIGPMMCSDELLTLTVLMRKLVWQVLETLALANNVGNNFKLSNDVLVFGFHSLADSF